MVLCDRLLNTHSAGMGKVMSADLSADERYVVSAYYDRTVKLWAHMSEY